jgi:tellurite resistance-related uncharacterized protein
MEAFMTDIPAKLPDNAEAYGRSPEFSSDNPPDKLRSAHSTKAGTWGLLHMLEGKLRFELEPPKQGVREVEADDTLVIEPETLHHVEFLEPGRFYVEFYRCVSA